MNMLSTTSNKMNTLVLQLVTLLKSYLPTVKREAGQGMVEYALIIALIAIVVIVAIPAVATAIGDAFDTIAGAL